MSGGYALTRADEIELEADSKMAEAAARAGKDKCLRVGCMTMIARYNNPTGLCRFHSSGPQTPARHLPRRESHVR